jgi:tripartite-type tricarboxylate transporter receptor subunit TctC
MRTPLLNTTRRWLAPLALAAAANAALAQDALRMIVPFPAGGAADSMARVLVDKLKDELGGQQVVVENKAGASTRLAAEVLKQSPADGKTVLITVLDTMTIAPLVYPGLRFDPAKDFAPITSVVNVTYGIAVKGDGPHKTLPQFLDAARADRKNASVGISGLGSTLHFLAYDFASGSKSEMQVVPFQGGPAMVNNLLGDQLPAAMDGLGVFVQHHKAGRLRVLAVSGEQRASQLPDVPTFKEAGLPRLSFGTAYGLYAPAGTPAAKIDEWNRAMKKVLAREDVRARLQEIGYEPLKGSTPAELTAMERAMSAHWTPIIKASGFKGE